MPLAQDTWLDLIAITAGGPLMVADSPSAQVVPFARGTINTRYEAELLLARELMARLDLGHRDFRITPRSDLWGSWPDLDAAKVTRVRSYLRGGAHRAFQYLRVDPAQPSEKYSHPSEFIVKANSQALDERGSLPNVGNGTLKVEPLPEYGPAGGSYRVVCTATAPHGGVFTLIELSRNILGEGITMTPGPGSTTTVEVESFRLTLTDGSVDFAVGDGFEFLAHAILIEYLRFHEVGSVGSKSRGDPSAYATELAAVVSDANVLRSLVVDGHANYSGEIGEPALDAIRDHFEDYLAAQEAGDQIAMNTIRAEIEGLYP